ncbi:MAG: DUF4337 domain-containing protein [Desulfobaccales bacterium]
MPHVELPKPEELEEIKAKAFTRRVALITGIFAVALAICNLGGSVANRNMLMAQQQASDRWAWYQAKDIRRHIDWNQKAILTLDLLGKDSLQPEVRKRYEEELQRVSEEEMRFNAEKAGIAKEAKHLEQRRDLYGDKDDYFEDGEVLLAIAIVLASIAILTTSRKALGVALVAASLGTLLAVNGFLMIVRLPFLTH